MTARSSTLAVAASLALLGAATAGTAVAQGADTSGALNAETGANTPQSAAPAPNAKRPHPRHQSRARTADASMNTDGAAPTGPDTTTAGAGDTSDLSGSTGATEKLPAGIAPPSPAPPGGAPSGGEVPNEQGGPHG